MRAGLTVPQRVTAQHAVAAVRALAAGRGSSTVLVGVDGFGGAGKSTLAAAVQDAVAAVTVIAVDDFWGPSIAEWDWQRFRAQVLRPLGAGTAARYQRWDWDRDAGAEWLVVPPGGVVIVEGVSSTRREVAAPWSLTVWVDAPAAVRRARALARDGPDVWRARWLADWIPSEQAYAARERPWERVDLVVSGGAPGAVEEWTAS